jgi:hypothetical protein
MKNDATEVPLWNIAVLVPKISEDARIELLVNYYPEKENISLSGTKLTGTKWKLAAFVDAQTNESIEPEPKEYNKCYTLEFDSDATAIGQSVLNTVNFIVTPSSIKVLGITKIWDGENNNVNLFYEALQTIDLYVYNKDELKIYYDGKNKYLLYKPLLQ